MFTSVPKRLLLLAGVALLLAVILIARWISSWGLVTIHVRDAPLRQVIASIQRQGHVLIETSLDPSTKVTMDADRVTSAEAVDQLALCTESSWRGAIVAAPSKTLLKEALLGLRANARPEGWTISYYPSPQFPMAGDSAIDPRTLTWTPQGPDLDLAKLLDEAAQKSGVMIVLPKDWSPAVPRLPRVAAVGKAIHELIGSIRGNDTSFFYLTEREQRRWGDSPRNEQPWEQPAASQAASPMIPGAASRPQPNPEWMNQRMLAHIEKLPTSERAEAKKEFDEMKSFREQTKNFPPEERRQKMREMMSDPAFAGRMADRMLARDSKLSAQQRISRAMNYLGRKQAAKASGITPGSPPPPR